MSPDKVPPTAADIGEEFDAVFEPDDPDLPQAIGDALVTEADVAWVVYIDDGEGGEWWLLDSTYDVIDILLP